MKLDQALNQAGRAFLPINYYLVLTALAEGPKTRSELAKASEVNRDTLDKIMARLIVLELVHRKSLKRPAHGGKTFGVYALGKAPPAPPAPPAQPPQPPIWFPRNLPYDI